MSSLILFYIPVPNQDVAEELATLLLEKRLIACANMVPMGSMYIWGGEQVAETELLLLAKTTPERAEEVRALVEQVHPYELPLIAHYPITVNDSYAAWVQQQVEPVVGA